MRAAMNRVESADGPTPLTDRALDAYGVEILEKIGRRQRGLISTASTDLPALGAGDNRYAKLCTLIDLGLVESHAKSMFSRSAGERTYTLTASGWSVIGEDQPIWE